MPANNPFYTEWQDCLRAHYQHVIRVHDEVTEPTLHGVLLETGFTEDDIHRFRFEVLGEIVEETPATETLINVEIVEVPVIETVSQSAPFPETAPEISLEPEPPRSTLDLEVNVNLEASPEPPAPLPKPPAQLSLF